MHINTKDKSRREYRLKTRTLGTIHPSGMNRATRRARIAEARGEAEKETRKRMDDAHELQKIQIAKRVERKQTASHEKAVARKDVAKGIKPSLTKRALTALKEATVRREERKRRKEAHARKVALQAKKNI